MIVAGAKELPRACSLAMETLRLINPTHIVAITRFAMDIP